MLNKSNALLAFNNRCPTVYNMVALSRLVRSFEENRAGVTDIPLSVGSIEIDTEPFFFISVRVAEETAINTTRNSSTIKIRFPSI